MLRRGTTRTVFLTKRLALKTPSLRSFRLFLRGLLANMQEAEFSKTGWKEICPVLFSLPLGFLVVMPRCREMDDYEWRNFDADTFSRLGEYEIPVENKRSSFGILDGKFIVAVDYGN